MNDTRETTQNFRTPELVMPFAGPGTLSFLPTFYTVAEGAGSVTLKVGRHAGSAGAISVNYATAPSTATAGADYTTTSGTLNWANGDTADKTIIVPILQDLVLEGNELFAVGLGGATGGATISGAGAAATVRITDDEPDTFPVGTLPGGFVSPNVPNANTPNSQWTVDLTQGNASPASLRSAQAYSPDGTFTLFGNSDLEYTGVFLAGNVTFDYKFSAYQSNYSGFEFQVDNVPVFTYNSGTAGGEIDWTPVSQAVTAGVHTLRWRFKNRLPFPCAGANPAPTGGANCADRAWIDNVAMPLAKAFDLSGEGRTDLVWAQRRAGRHLAHERHRAHRHRRADRRGLGLEHHPGRGLQRRHEERPRVETHRRAHGDLPHERHHAIGHAAVAERRSLDGDPHAGPERRRQGRPRLPERRRQRRGVADERHGDDFRRLDHRPRHGLGRDPHRRLRRRRQGRPPLAPHRRPARRSG